MQGKTLLMIFLYIFIFVRHSLIVHSAPFLKSQNEIQIVDEYRHGQSSNTEYCRTNITYTGIMKILEKNACQSKIKQDTISDRKNRNPRDVNAGNTDIHAIQTTVNDHRVMIEYLVNNSINQTFLANALYNHSRNKPSLTNWRDLVDLLCITVFIIITLYFLICRVGIHPFDQLIIYLFTPVLNRTLKKNKSSTGQSDYTTTPTTVNQQLNTLSMFADNISGPNKQTNIEIVSIQNLQTIKRISIILTFSQS